MELFNELPEEREQAIDDFLTFIGIYESRRRFISLRAFLKRNKKLIRDKVCLEAGAGKGLFAREMRELGASKVYAVERSPVLAQILRSQCEGLDRLEVVEEDIQDFEPAEPIDVLFHEFYGSLILDESILALNDLPFTPANIIPNGGRLWAMPITEAQLADDKLYEPIWKEALSGALISDLFEGIKFKPEWLVFDWELGGNVQKFEFELPGPADFIALCGEITHAGKTVLKLWNTFNWPIIFTPVSGKRFELDFRYVEGFSEVYFKWIKEPRLQLV